MTLCLKTLGWFSRQRAGHEAPVEDNMQNLGELKTLPILLHWEKMKDKVKEIRYKSERKERAQCNERNEENRRK